MVVVVMVMVVLEMVHFDSGGEGKGDGDGKSWYPAAPALRQGVRKDVVGGVGSSDDGSRGDVRGDVRGDGRADGDGVGGKLWKVMICSSKSSGSRRERRSGWYDDVAFGVSSDDGGGDHDGGGDDCGDEDDLDRGCCGDGDGDGGQCHLDRKGSKSQLTINLLFHKFLLNKGGCIYL